MIISLILALADNDVLGKRGSLLPWHLRSDLVRFKNLTTGHALIMGRKTYATIGRPLPNRHNIIITANPAFSAEGATVVHSFQEALGAAAGAHADEVFVAGGATIYDLAMPHADRIYLTRVHGHPHGDVHFKLDLSGWDVESREQHPADANNDYNFTWELLTRRHD